MRLPIRALALVYRLAGVVIIAIGVIRVLGLGTPDFSPAGLLYYTSVSNLLGLAWTVVATVVTIARIRRSGVRGNASVVPPVGAGVALALLVTALIYLVLVAPGAFTQDSGSEPFTLTDNLVHIIGPALVMGDWLLFARRGSLRWWDPLWWAAIPYAYVAFALLRPLVTDALWPNGSRYPYPFFDPSDKGWGGVALYLLVITIVIEALAYVMVGFDRLAARRRRDGASPGPKG